MFIYSSDISENQRIAALAFSVMYLNENSIGCLAIVSPPPGRRIPMLTSSHSGVLDAPFIIIPQPHAGIPKKPGAHSLLLGRQSLHPRNWQIVAGEPNLACGFYFCMSYELLRIICMLKRKKSF